MKAWQLFIAVFGAVFLAMVGFFFISTRFAKPDLYPKPDFYKRSKEEMEDFKKMQGVQLEEIKKLKDHYAKLMQSDPSNPLYKQQYEMCETMEKAFPPTP